MYNKKEVEWIHRRDILLYKHPIFTEDDSVDIPYIKSKKQGKKKRTPYEEMGEPDKVASDKRRKRYYERRVHEIADLAIHNGLDTFITLTFRKNITDYSEAKELWKNFTKRLRYHLEKKGIELKYIAVHEFQKKRGDVYHFHALTNTGFIPQSDLQRLWAEGYTFIEIAKRKKKEDSQYDFIAYITKYISKTIIDEEMQQERNHRRKIYYSQNLEKPKISKVMSDEGLKDVVYANLEDVMETSSYKMRNYKSEQINEVDHIKIRKE